MLISINSLQSRERCLTGYSAMCRAITTSNAPSNVCCSRYAIHLTSRRSHFFGRFQLNSCVAGHRVTAYGGRLSFEAAVPTRKAEQLFIRGDVADAIAGIRNACCNQKPLLLRNQDDGLPVDCRVGGSGRYDLLVPHTVAMLSMASALCVDFLDDGVA